MERTQYNLMSSPLVAIERAPTLEVPQHPGTVVEPECGACRYSRSYPVTKRTTSHRWFGTRVTDEQVTMWACHRFPKVEQIVENYWCGEFKVKGRVE